MCSIINQINALGHKCLVYVDYIVIVSRYKHIELAINSSDNALNSLHNALSASSFYFAPEKCKFLIFTRQHYRHCPHTTTNDYTIIFIQNHSYLGLNMDSKLCWSLYIINLTKFIARWSNFIRLVTNVWWGSHPSTLILIYKSVIRVKLDYSYVFLVFFPFFAFY